MLNGDQKTLYDRLIDLIEFHLNTIILDTEEMVEERLQAFVAEFMKVSKAKGKKENKDEENEENEENASKSIVGYFATVMRELDRKFVELDDAEKSRIKEEIRRGAIEHTQTADSLIEYSFNDDTEEELSTPVLRNEAKFRLPLQSLCRTIFKRHVGQIIEQLRLFVKKTGEFSEEILTPQKNTSEIKVLAMKESLDFKRLLRLWYSMSNPKKSRKITTGFVQHPPLDFEKKILPEMLEKVDALPLQVFLFFITFFNLY